jgi:hypothetical protein
LIRYDLSKNEPLQSVVLIDSNGDFEEAYEPVSDDLLKRYLETRSKTAYKSPLNAWNSKKVLDTLNPFKANISDPEYLPTNAFNLLEKLKTNFPKHRLLVSDFHYLPDTIAGIDAPVVQARHKSIMVPCSTYMVKPGLFDIFFPTNFKLLGMVYKELNGRESLILSHSEFLNKYGDKKSTTTRNGENPMLSYYENVSFFLS